MLRTAEFVSPKHPDKICDQISDAILDACLTEDSDSRVAVESMGGHGIITVTGEITTRAYVDIPYLVHSVAGPNYGVQVNIVRQSPEIASGVDSGGAGDQGIMVGYACNETRALMPLEYVLARDLCKDLYSVYPADGKTQVTVNEKKEIVAVVASWCGVDSNELLGLVDGWLLKQESVGLVIKNCYRYVNPAGKWDIGGFDSDTGLTGRKIVIDAYGPRVQVGGGAYSGKDPSKVDRSAAYMARKLAVEYLRKHEASECRIEIAYAIGKPEPLQAVAWINAKVFEGYYVDVTGYDLTPKGIINFLDLKKPIYQETATWGHYGNDFKWDS